MHMVHLRLSSKMVSLGASFVSAFFEAAPARSLSSAQTAEEEFESQYIVCFDHEAQWSDEACVLIVLRDRSTTFRCITGHHEHSVSCSQSYPLMLQGHW